MSQSVMQPRLEVLTSLEKVHHIPGTDYYSAPAVRMSNGRTYTHPNFVVAPLYSKFAVLFEDEGDRAGTIIQSIRID